MEDKIKYFFILIFIFILILSGGIFKSNIKNNTGNLKTFLIEFKNSVNIEYNSIRTTRAEDCLEKQYAHIKHSKEPYSFYQRIGTLKDESFVFIENLLEENGLTAKYLIKTAYIQPFSIEKLFISDKGEFSIDKSLLEESEERTSILKGKEKELMIRAFDQSTLQDTVHLIEANIDSFESTEETSGNKDYVKYIGGISVESVIDRYLNCGRENIKSTLELLRAEIKLSGNVDRDEAVEEIRLLYDAGVITTDIYELALAEDPISISIWIPQNKAKSCKIKLDYNYFDSDVKKNGSINIGVKKKFNKNIEYLVF